MEDGPVVGEEPGGAVGCGRGVRGGEEDGACDAGDGGEGNAGEEEFGRDGDYICVYE